MDIHRAQWAHSFIDRLDKRYKMNKAVGWIYALRNSEFRRPLLKIGMTKKYPQQRAHELGSATGVPGKFDIVYFVHSSDCRAAEALVHEKLAEYRTSGEFFDIPIRKAVKVMDEAAARYPIYVSMMSPNKRGGRGSEILPQAFDHGLAVCSHCGRKNKIHELAVPDIPKCGKCRRSLVDGPVEFYYESGQLRQKTTLNYQYKILGQVTLNQMP